MLNNTGLKSSEPLTGYCQNQGQTSISELLKGDIFYCPIIQLFLNIP